MARAETATPVEDPGLTPRIISVGARVWSVSIAFSFFGFLFAYVYLRALNVNGMWNPGLRPPVGLSVATGAAVLLSGLVGAVGVRRIRAEDLGGWRRAAMPALVLGASAVVLHVWELRALPFDPIDGSYASVYVGWNVWLLVFELGAVYWLETLVARSLRSRAAAGPDELPFSLIEFRTSAEAFAFVWWLLVAIEVIAFVLLDVVR